MTETLKSVATAGTGEINWILIGVVGVLFVLIAGWYFLIHKRGKDAQAKVVAAEVGSTVVADLTAALTKAHGIIDNLTALLAEHIDPTKPKVVAGTVTTPSARAELNEWADGTWPAGHVPAGSGTVLAHEAIPVLQPSAAVRAAPLYDPAAVEAARRYRVAIGLYGANDSRTMVYVGKLAAYPHWSDVLAYVGDAGFDKAAEDSIRAQLQAA